MHGAGAAAAAVAQQRTITRASLKKQNVGLLKRLLTAILAQGFFNRVQMLSLGLSLLWFPRLHDNAWAVAESAVYTDWNGMICKFFCERLVQEQLPSASSPWVSCRTPASRWSRSSKAPAPGSIQASGKVHPSAEDSNTSSPQQEAATAAATVAAALWSNG
jgi:hypothetical protein